MIAALTICLIIFGLGFFREIYHGAEWLTQHAAKWARKARLLFTHLLRGYHQYRRAVSKTYLSFNS